MLRIAAIGRLGAQTARAATRIPARSITNYYAIFPQTLPNGPPPNGKFEVDTKQLRNEYLKLQQGAHPDVAKGSEQYDSATLGNAYRALSDPLLRAQHILRLNGIDPLSEATALHDEDLLMDIMLIREEAAEAEDPADRKALNDANEKRISDEVAAVDAAFAANDLDEAHNAAIKLSYWMKLRDTLREGDGA